MRLPEICIKRPVLALVLNLLLIIMGIVGYRSLDTTFFPKIDVPSMTITITFAGQSASAMEVDITDKIENVLGDVEGIKSISSSSSIGRSTITINFPLGANIDHEVNLVRDKISSVKDLPKDMDPPNIQVGGIGQQVLNVAIQDNKRSQDEIRDYSIHYLIPLIEQVPGVGVVYVHGGGSYAIRIWLNPEKMASLNITAKQVSDVFTASNLDFAAGKIRQSAREFSVVTDTRISTLKEFREMVILRTGNRIVRLGDIATIERGHSSLDLAQYLINGKSAVGLEIKPRNDANPIDVAKGVKKEIQKLSKNLPAGMSLKILYDRSDFLKGSIHETYVTLAEAIVLVMIVILVFLGTFRASVIPIITIPCCLVAAFGAMYLFGFTINMLTLLALVLAIGLVVDDAIVMVENVYRHIEDGMAPLKAAITGSKEIAFPIIVMSLTLVAVYAPIGLTQGWSAMILKEFAFTLAAAVVISSFIALTLSPMLCSKLLKSHESESRYGAWLEKTFHRVATFYQQLLRILLTKKLFVILGLVIFGGLGILLFRMMPSEFIPNEDTGYILSDITEPPGASLRYAMNYGQALEKVYAAEPAIANTTSQINVGWEYDMIFLKPWGVRSASTSEVIDQMNSKLANVPGGKAYLYMPSVIQKPPGSCRGVCIQLMTPGDYTMLQKPLHALMQKVSHYPGLINLDQGLKYNSIQYALKINRNLAGDLGVNLQDISDAVSMMLNGKKIGYIEQFGISYPVYVQLKKQELAGFGALNLLFVKSTTTSNRIPLSALVSLTQRLAQPSLAHYNRFRSASFSGQLAPGYSMDQVLPYLQKIVPQVLGPEIQYSFYGDAQQYIESQGAMTAIVILALVFIYLMLSAQFGSFLDPFIILLTVPFCVVAAIATLWLAGGTLNIYSQVGLLTLVGLISKHGILITQFANNLRQEGTSLVDAAIQAASIRLRPILMTTFAMVFGALPLALSSGPGSVSRADIGWTIVGGMFFGTFFSLIIIPIAYCLIGQFKHIDSTDTKS